MSNDGVYSSSRGGYSYSGNSYTTWMNNGPSGSGVYSFLDRPIKFPTTHNDITINVGTNINGGGKWWQPLVSSLTRLGVAGIGIGIFAGIKKGAAAKAQAQAEGQGSSRFNVAALGILMKNSYNSIINNFKPVIALGDPGNLGDSSPVGKVGDPDSTPTGFKAKAINGNYKPIQGDVEQIGSLLTEGDGKGYPEKFLIKDSTTTKDPNHPNVYTYKFLKMNNGKPVYQCIDVKYYGAEGAKGTQVAYITDGITKDKGITSNLQMAATDNPQGSTLHVNKLGEYKEGAQPIHITFP